MTGGGASRTTRRRGRTLPVLALLLTLWTAGVTTAGPIPVTCGFTAALTASPAAGVTPLLVRLNASVSAGVPSEFQWNFGDGTYWNASGAGASTPLHRYAAPGTFTVTTTAVEGGCGQAASATVVISPGPVVVVITATPAGGPAPLLVQFNVSITGGTGTYTGADWTFGDGGAGVGAGLDYRYTHTGTYTASVSVTDSAQDQGNDSVTITVFGPPSTVPGWVPWVAGGAATLAALAAVGGWTWRRRRAAPSGVEPVVPATEVAPPFVKDDVPAPPTPRPAEGAADEAVASTPPRAADRPLAPPPLPAERRQLSRSVLLHIGAQGRLGPAEVAPFGLTQSGMAQSLAVGQNSLTNVLRRLVAAGVIEQDVRHVSGQPRRLRVYRLTARGEALYQEVRRRPEVRGNPPET